MHAAVLHGLRSQATRGGSSSGTMVVKKDLPVQPAVRISPFDGPGCYGLFSGIWMLIAPARSPSLAPSRG